MQLSCCCLENSQTTILYAYFVYLATDSFRNLFDTITKTLFTAEIDNIAIFGESVKFIKTIHSLNLLI